MGPTTAKPNQTPRKPLASVKVGTLFMPLSMFAVAALAFIVIVIAAGDSSWAPAPAVLFGLIVLVAFGETMLARHQDRKLTAAANSEGLLPVLAVPLTDPFNMDGDLPDEEVNLHDYPPGNPARRAIREAAASRASSH
jgi:hypothetical protein